MTYLKTLRILLATLCVFSVYARHVKADEPKTGAGTASVDVSAQELIGLHESQVKSAWQQMESLIERQQL